MEAIYTPRFQGLRWTILYGPYVGIERYAVDQVQKLVQKYLPYVIRVLPASETSSIPTDHLILIGTPDNNPQTNELLWGLPVLKLTDSLDRLKIKEMVLDNYQRHYQSLDLDGIYFQTLTEHSTTEEGGITTTFPRSTRDHYLGRCRRGSIFL